MRVEQVADGEFIAGKCDEVRREAQLFAKYVSL
jgi:hypothetical protein